MPVQPILYPAAKWTPLVGHSAPGTLAQKALIVLHVTDGPTAAGAITWFRQTKAPNRLSAHFVIDRDGTVFQLLDLRDVAWHADNANSYSIGIEHAAIAGKLMATDAQYQASAALVAWLCRLLNIPCDRSRVVEHCEVDKSTTHALCCHGALDRDRVVTLANAS